MPSSSRALDLHVQRYASNPSIVLRCSLPINQFAPLNGDKCGSFQVSKRALFFLIWAFSSFVREMESPELLLNLPLWLRGHGKIDVSVTA